MSICKSPFYAIEYSCINTGKRVAGSKKRIVWRFGITNQRALEEGKKGIECRGEEHEVVLIWSVASGKRVVLHNSQEIHFSSNRNPEFQVSWALRGRDMDMNNGPKTLHIVALLHPSHISPKQYNLLVDRQSIFNLPRLAHIGLPMQSSVSGYGGYSNERSMSHGGGGGYAQRRRSFGANTVMHYEMPKTAAEEEAYLAEAIRNSLVEEREHPYKHSQSSAETVKSAPSGRRRESSSHAPKPQDDLLLDLLSDPTPGPAPTLTPLAPTSAMMAVEDPFAPKTPSAMDGIMAAYNAPSAVSTVSPQQYNNYSVQPPMGGTPGTGALVPSTSMPTQGMPGYSIPPQSTPSFVTPTKATPTVTSPSPAVVSPTMMPSQPPPQVPASFPPPVPSLAPVSVASPTSVAVSAPSVSEHTDEYANPFLMDEPPKVNVNVAPTVTNATTTMNAPSMAPSANYQTGVYQQYAPTTQTQAPPPSAGQYGNGLYSVGTMGMAQPNAGVNGYMMSGAQ